MHHTEQKQKIIRTYDSLFENMDDMEDCYHHDDLDAKAKAAAKESMDQCTMALAEIEPEYFRLMGKENP